MSLQGEIISQEPQDVGLVRRRPLLTKHFIPNQDLQQASTSTEGANPVGLFEPLEEIRGQTVHLEDSFEKEAIEISEEAHISESPNNVAPNYANNLYNRSIKSKISKRENSSKRKKKSIKNVPPRSACSILNDFRKTHYHIEGLHKNKKLEWRASVVVDDFEYIGFGRSKIAAKNAAAQLALKDIYSKLLYNQTTSYDIFQMLSSWSCVFNNCTPNRLQLNQGKTTNNYEEKITQPLERMDPVVLITQSMKATFTEVSKGSHPKNITFLFRCNVGQDSFFGVGHSKKVAKRMAAYEACSKVLGIKYSKRIYVSSS